MHLCRYTLDFGSDRPGNIAKELNLEMLKHAQSIHDNKQDLTGPWSILAGGMMGALRKLPAAKGPFYRCLPGVCFEISVNYTAGREVVWVGFTPVFKILENAFNMTAGRCCVLKLNVSTARDVSKFRHRDDQPDCILLPNSKFIVLPGRYQTQIYHRADCKESVDVNVIELQQIGP
jgi:hypothetical protein